MKTIEHFDQIDQPIRPGQTVAFAYANSPGIKLGTVKKLTRQRVRIAYKFSYVKHGTNEVAISEWNYLSTPERVLVISDSLGAELTMLKLKGLLP